MSTWATGEVDQRLNRLCTIHFLQTQKSSLQRQISKAEPLRCRRSEGLDDVAPLDDAVELGQSRDATN